MFTMSTIKCRRAPDGDRSWRMARAKRISKPLRPHRNRRPPARSDELYHHGNLREALMAGALELVRERGAAHLSLREVARRAGVSHAAPYRHFADKNSLLGAIALEGFRLLTLALEESRVGREPLDAFRESGIAYVRFALAHPAHLAVMFGSVIEDPQQCEGLLEEGAGAFDVLVRIIEAAQTAGRLRSGDSRTLALAAWSMVHGLAMLTGPQNAVRPEAAEEIARAMTGLLFEGMQAQETRAHGMQDQEVQAER